MSVRYVHVFFFFLNLIPAEAYLIHSRGTELYIYMELEDVVGMCIGDWQEDLGVPIDNYILITDFK